MTYSNPTDTSSSLRGLIETHARAAVLQVQQQDASYQPTPAESNALVNMRHILQRFAEALEARVVSPDFRWYVQHKPKCHLHKCHWRAYPEECTRNEGHTCTCGLDALLAREGHAAPPLDVTMRAIRLDAAMTALESIQAQGYFQHDADGRILDIATTVKAIATALNQAAALPPPPAPERET